jgi:pyruvate dehydrogenase E2 component (dihydrolipoamide acetyltransferase)
MPALSPSVERSKIVEWKKAEGDAVGEDEAIASIQTDKAELDWRVTDDVYLAKILLPAGIEVAVNDPVAIFVEDKAHVAAFKDYKIGQSDAGTPPADAPSSPAPSSSGAAPASSKPAPQIKAAYEVHGMPALSPTATEGAVVEWLVKEGDHISEGMDVAQIQTDKSAVSWAAIDDGYVAKLLVPADANNKLEVNAPIAVFVENKADIAEIQAIDASFFLGGAQGGDSGASAASPASEGSAAAAAASGRTPSIHFRHGDRQAGDASGDRVFASPYAKKIAADLGIDLNAVGAGSGERGRITEADVRAFSAKAPAKAAKAVGGGAAPAKAAAVAPVPSIAPIGQTDRSHVDEPASTMRQVIAKRLSESMHNSPHYYVSVDCEMDALIKLRKEINGDGKEGYAVSVNDFIVKAAALALRDVPECNVSWLGDALRKYNYVDISVAVATPAGLITPIVTDADARSLLSISQNVKELAKRARDNQLAPHEFQGGTLTISNLGMFGVSNFTAIINPPQSCIIALGAARQECKPDASDPRGFRPVSRMSATISSDHRSVDGATAARYMAAFRKYIENPGRMLAR